MRCGYAFIQLGADDPEEYIRELIQATEELQTTVNHQATKERERELDQRYAGTCGLCRTSRRPYQRQEATIGRIATSQDASIRGETRAIANACLHNPPLDDQAVDAAVVLMKELKPDYQDTVKEVEDMVKEFDKYIEDMVNDEFDKYRLSEETKIVVPGGLFEGLFYALDSSGDGLIDKKEFASWWKATEACIEELKQATEEQNPDNISIALTTAWSQTPPSASRSG